MLRNATRCTGGERRGPAGHTQRLDDHPDPVDMNETPSAGLHLTDHTHSRQEKEADAFAAEFLTPQDSILPLLPKRMDLARLAELREIWGVSIHSLVYRCRELGLTSDATTSRTY
jgi:hypothetical protein